MLTRRILLASLGAMAAAPVLGAPPVEVTEPWVRLGRKGQPSAAFYCSILNHGEADKLLGISTNVCEKVTLCRLAWHGLTPELTPLAAIDLPAVHRITLAPGGFAAVLENLFDPLRVGQHVPLSLQFEHAGRLDVMATVSNQLLGNR